MSIKRTFTIYKLIRNHDGELKEMSFSRQSQAEQYKEIMEHFGIDDLTIETEKRVIEL